MSTPADIINQAFVDLAVIQPGMTIPAMGSMQTDAFARLNLLMASLSTEGATVQTQQFANVSLQADLSIYTAGPGGTWNLATRPQKLTSWSASFQNFRSGGQVISFPEFQAQAKDTLGGSSILPMIIGADTAFPLLNARVFPAPANSLATIDLGFWIPLAQFATLADVINLPPGFEDMLHFNLAMRLYTQYARPNWDGLQALAANAQNTKAVIVAQNSGAQPAPAAAQ